MINVLFAALEARWHQYEGPLRQAFAERGLDVELRTEFAPDEVDYVVYAPNSDLQDFTAYTRTKAVLNLWAGVEGITNNETLTQPLARMVDDGLTNGMIEWVTGHVLRHHLGMDTHIHGLNGEWRNVAPPLAQDRNVTVLGLGELGIACAEMLRQLNFKVTGWSRRTKEVEGVTCLSGEDGLDMALRSADILVLLLPLTPQTENLLDRENLSKLPKGSILLNPGRGGLIDDDALLDALDKGTVAHATLDVFRVEPLPNDHPYWSHPTVTVTPHIASETRPESASRVIAENIDRSEQGLPLNHLVDRAAGY